MKTILVANPKGGSGKSTATVHLAVAAEHAGDGPVIITDTDPQGSTVDWYKQRKSAGIETPRYTGLTLSDMKATQQRLADAGAEYFFIDTAPSIAEVNEKLFASADLLLIPLNPTAADLRSLRKGLPTIVKARKPFVFMLSRVRANLTNNESIASALENLGLVLPTRMHERVIYAESFADGMTVFDLDPQGVAALELGRLWRNLKAKISDKTNSRKA